MPSLDEVATGGYFGSMNISIKEAKNRFSELVRRAEAGETVVITRDGKPVADLTIHKLKKGINFEGLREYKRQHGIGRVVEYIADDFDDPLPEDFLITPFPFDKTKP
jgi:antitoxin (DNA-binding transcriptional repressor) of toxin-antitoxin stability system